LVGCAWADTAISTSNKGAWANRIVKFSKAS
jgi:hypothetical protein